MKYCRNCHCKINTDKKRCPICLTSLEDLDNNSTNTYPHIEKKQTFHLSLTEKILLLVSIIIMIASIFFNYKYLDQSKPFYWWVLVVVGIPYIWLLVRYVILSKADIDFKILSMTSYTLLLPIVCEIIIRLFSKQDFVLNWSLRYVIPGILILSNVSLAIITIIFKKLYNKCVYILWLLSFVSIVYYIFTLIFPLYFNDILSILSLISAIGVLLSTLIFNFDATKEEFIKRFHI